MSKQRKMRRKIGSAKSDYGEIADSSSSSEEISTTAPNNSFEQTSSLRMLSEDSTNATAGKRDLKKEDYADSYPELVDKYVLKKGTIPFVLLVGAICLIFIQDNGAGKLSNWNEIIWFLLKSGVIFSLYILLSFLNFAYNKMFGK